jgi:hypothetical protein
MTIGAVSTIILVVCKILTPLVNNLPREKAHGAGAVLKSNETAMFVQAGLAALRPGRRIQ